MRELLIATRNQGKLPEIKAALAGMPFQILNLDDANVPKDFEVEESAQTFEGNAILKAILYGKKSGKLTLAEDSGVEVDALGGRPGVLSARYASGSDKARYEKLLQELIGVPYEDRGAQFRAVAALYDPDREKIWTTEGVVRGHVVGEARGAAGFGYDPVFYSDDLEKTFGEASATEKGRVSHRGRALAKMREILTSQFE